jgi:hypothetical protein
MFPVWRALYSDERGFVLTAELIIISTVLVLGLITAFACVQASVVAELKDVGGAIGSLNQSYVYGGMKGCQSWCGLRSRTYGSSFLDTADSSEELRADFGVYVETYGQAVVAAPAVVNPCESAVVVQGAVVDGAVVNGAVVSGTGTAISSCVTNAWAPGVPSPAAAAGGAPCGMPLPANAVPGAPACGNPGVVVPPGACPPGPLFPLTPPNCEGPQPVVW